MKTAIQDDQRAIHQDAAFAVEEVMIWIVQNADSEIVGVYASREAAMLAHGERLGIAGDDWSLSGPWLIRREDSQRGGEE